MTTFATPNTFTAGTTISSSEMNANFDHYEAGLNGSLSDDNISSTAGIYSAYRTIFGPTYMRIVDTASNAVFVSVSSGSSVLSGNSQASGIVPIFYLDDADYTISGKTTKLRIRVIANTNATAPAVTFTAGLYPVSSNAGAADAATLTVGSVVAGSTAAIVSPSASGRANANSGDFTIPSDDYYTPAVLVSGVPAADSYTGLTIIVQQRWV